MICGLSGGVDSSVAALLVHRAVGEQLTCVFVDHGLMRHERGRAGRRGVPRSFGIPLVHVDAEERFLARLAGRRRPRAKRKIIGEEFIRVFEEEAREARGRRLPGPGHPLLGRDRVGRRRPAADRSSRTTTWAACPTISTSTWSSRCGCCSRTRCARRRRARPARPDGLAPALPRPGPGDPDRRRRGHQGAAGHPPHRRRDPPGGGPRRRASTASSGSPSACCRWSARSASRATAGPTPTRS